MLPPTKLPPESNIHQRNPFSTPAAAMANTITTTTTPPTFTASRKVFSLPKLRNYILLSLSLTLPSPNSAKPCTSDATGTTPEPQMQEVRFLKPYASHRIAIIPSEDAASAYYHEKGWRDPWMLLRLRGAMRRCKPVLKPFLPFDDGRVRTNVLFFHQGEARHSEHASWPAELFLQPPALRVKFVCLGGYLSNALEPPSNEDMDTMYEGVEVVDRQGVDVG